MKNVNKKIYGGLIIIGFVIITMYGGVFAKLSTTAAASIEGGSENPKIYIYDEKRLIKMYDYSARCVDSPFGLSCPGKYHHYGAY